MLFVFPFRSNYTCNVYTHTHKKAVSFTNAEREQLCKSVNFLYLVDAKHIMKGVHLWFLSKMTTVIDLSVGGPDL